MGIKQENDDPIQEASARLFTYVYVKDRGPFREEAWVIGVRDYRCGGFV